MAVTDGIFSSKAELNSSLQASQFGTNIKPLSSSEQSWLDFIGKDRYGNDTGWGQFLTMFNSLDPGIGPYFDNARGTAYDDVMKSKNDDVTKAHELADTEGYRLAHHQKQWSKKMEAGIAFGKVFSMASGAAAGGAGAGAAGGGDAVAGAMSKGGLAEGTMPLTTMAGKSGGLGSSTALEGVKLSAAPSIDIAGSPQFALDPSKSTLGTLGGQAAGMFDYKPTEEEKSIADKKQTVMDQLKKYSNNAEAPESFANIFKVGGGIANVNTTGNTSAAAEAYNKEMANLASHEGDLDVMDSIPIVNIFAGFSKSVYDINASRDAQEAKVKYYLQSLPRSMNLDESQFIG